ncbi:UNVERIFIED_CONTAM: O-fucosyltransferase 36 [Sesamum calycinum]|uniref:GDP-fucose protein O-fucosyltransferase 2 n=1 Tax=Sesamum calycinum TaxID=2727403 RepID=A0AAW2NDY1_9LAMI
MLETSGMQVKKLRGLYADAVLSFIFKEVSRKAEMMERESSDEEEDRENLISQNARSNDVVKSPNHRHRSAFHIDDDFRSRLSSVTRRFHKRYLMAIFLPMLILILYFTTDLRSLFQMRIPTIKNIGGNSPSIDRMRESELRALYLLKQQELELFKMWNYTTLVNKSNFSLVNNSNLVNLTAANNNGVDLLSSSMLEDLKSRVFSQISLNKQIQGVLLSSHENGGSLELNENYTDASFSGWNGCRKVDQRLSERRTMEWKPRSDKYLFAICVSGQMSNHLICLEKHMFFAALLNRILVIPSSKVDFEFHRVLDIEHINKCLGRKVVVTFEEFAESKKKHLHIDKLMCYFSSPQPCYMDDERVKKLKGLGLSLGKIEAVWNEDVKKPNQRTVQDVLAKFSSDDNVIAIGDVFFADVEREWVMQPGGPIAHKCKTLIEPSRLILLTAQRFIQTFLGKDFIALHFRRHGFLKFCNAKQPSCFYPVPQAAECINRLLERANTPVIYLSTDAAESETGLLQSLLVWNGKTVPLVRRPARNFAEKWDALLYRHGLDGDSQVEAMLDKTICALSSVFIGSSGSTFTEDILRLRKDWGSASLCDEYLCQGELPNFTAEDEGRNWCFSRSIDPSLLAPQSSNTPSTLKDLFSKIFSSSQHGKASSEDSKVELAVDFVANKVPAFICEYQLLLIAM